MILLFGMPRSGSTWIGKILDSHPDTLYRHEPDSRQRIDVPLAPSMSELDKYAEVLENYSLQVLEARGLKVSGKLPIFPKSYQSPLGFRIRQLMLLGLKFSTRYWPQIENAQCPDMIRNNNNRPPRVVWKSIESIGRLGLIAKLMPESHGILLLRHPCGYISSVLRGEKSGRFGSDTPASDDYGVFAQLLETEYAQKCHLTMDAMHAMTQVERLAWRWVLWNEKAMNDIRLLPNCTYVRYEDFCVDAIQETRRMFEFCGLTWHVQTENFLVASTTRNNDAYYSVYKDPSKVVASWRHHLDEDDIDKIANITSASTPGSLFVDSGFSDDSGKTG